MARPAGSSTQVASSTETLRTRDLISGDPALRGQPIKLRTSNLSFFYGGFRALKDVSLSIAERKITALIGPSGCGKSTLLSTFNRMYELTPGARVKGSIRLGHEEITTAGNLQQLRRRVGMVFQRANPFHMSIYERKPGVRRPLGRCLRPPASVRHLDVRRSAAAALHCALHRGQAGSGLDG